MSQQIQAIRFDVEDIGKHVKSSKKRFSWTFGLNGRNHTIILDFSFISGKVKLIVDRKTMLETQLPTNTSFQHPFTLDGFAVNILQQGQSFELRINNKVFSHLYNQAKTNTQFRNYEEQVKDIKVDEGSFQNTTKTVKLNIGALDGGKKKTKTTTESENWNDFGGSGLGIPSYFGDSSSSTTSQKRQQKPKANLLDSDEQQQSPKGSIPPKVQQVQKKNSGEIDFFANQQSNSVVSTSPSQQHLQQIKAQQTNKDDFNTMQNMFATVNISQTPQTTQPQSGLDLLNSATNAQPNYSDYNTMQNLFATQNPTFQPPGAPITLATSTNPVTTAQFNTMQNLFATNAYTMPTATVSSGQVPLAPMSAMGNNASFPTPNQFNTMQNLFATGAQGTQQIPSNPSMTVPMGTQNLNTMQNLFATGTPPVAVGTAGTQNYNTMQNLFATGNQGGITLAQLQANPTALENNAKGNDFNTMQNFFATSNQPTSNLGMSQPNADLQNINIQDFNTMQNLFKTGSGVILPPPQTETKKEDPFSLLGSQSQQPQVQASHFSTYSGPKSNITLEVNASSFGTMQKGAVGNIDFFQAQTTTQTVTQTSEVPNFSKKKPAVQQDLI